MLEAKGLMAFYENMLALNNVSMRCEDKQIVGVFGANSAGKSTLMYTLSGIMEDIRKKEAMAGGERITVMGEVIFLGEDITRLKPSRRARKGLILCPERRRIFKESSVLENMKIGASAYAVYLGVNKDYGKVLPEGTHTIFVNSTSNGMQNFKYFTEGNPEKSLFGLINYTAKDPSNVAKGKCVIAIVSMLPYNYMDNWQIDKGYDAYDALKKKIAKVYIKRAEKYLPGLSKHIEVMEVGTPRTMERYTSNPTGTIFGYEYNREQSMLKRLPQTTPIENLYLAGAWTFPGGGQSAVLISGSMAADTILGEE